MKKQGFNRVQAMLARITPAIEAEFEDANRDNAHMIVDVAKVLIPEESGASRAAMATTDAGDKGQLIDFGPKAKVIEGGKGPRPFVNPALESTKKSRTARNKQAMQRAIKATN